MKIKYCISCDLCLTNKFIPVSGRGNTKSNIMIIGEAPGYYERRANIPFCGKSGQLLQFIINRYNFKDTTYITNAVKCRPPNNRPPIYKEIEKCNKYLIAEISIIKPKIIILLGNTAIEAYYGYRISISKLSGKVIKSNPRVAFLYHPAYILRNVDHIRDYIKVFENIANYYRLTIDASHRVLGKG